MSRRDDAMQLAERVLDRLPIYNGKGLDRIEFMALAVLCLDQANDRPMMMDVDQAIDKLFTAAERALEALCNEAEAP